jgi:undecaprenyl diphosphate synthase
MNRIQPLIDRYLTLDALNERVAELPQQFEQPQDRPWQAIAWDEISPTQIVGIELDAFCAILQGAIDTEAPIRDYTQASRQYLEPVHLPLARFVGGTVGPSGKLQEIGLWEREERRHTPALSKIYGQLTGEKIKPQLRQVRPYQASDNAHQDLYRHGLHRVATEYGATCLYLWLMAHTTGALHQVLLELMLDEINHMAKYWGFGTWAFPETSLIKVFTTLATTSQGQLKYSQKRGNLLGTIDRMAKVLGWSKWSWGNRFSFMGTCIAVMQRMMQWHGRLDRLWLNSLFGAALLSSNQAITGAIETQIETPIAPSLPSHLQVPRHVAVIMDGNGRWATQRNLPRLAGHYQGAKTLKQVVRACKDWGIEVLTVYAFSTENWRRPTTEVNYLFSLFETLLGQELAELQAEGVRLSFLGDLSVLPEALKTAIAQTTEATQHNRRLHLNVAVNYGGRMEITQAVQTIAQQVQQGLLEPSAITESTIANALYTANLPDPDLLIRTSHELRLSNFLPWQSAYTELYFTKTLWPDFDRTAFLQAIQAYQQRDRRFGQVGISSNASISFASIATQR